MLFSLSAVAQNADSVIGEWINELGSVLVIDSVSEKTGEIYGVYRSSAGVDGKEFPLIGWVNDQEQKPNMHHVVTLAFSVRWSGYGSITSWTGYLTSDEDGPYIKTIWNLVRPNTDLAFEHIMTNSSTFRPNSGH